MKKEDRTLEELSIDDMEEQLSFWALEKGADWSIKIETGYESCWSAELRMTPKPNNQDGPDVSTVFFAGGAGTPDEAMRLVFFPALAIMGL